jgi:tRNA (guanine-N7-)-methyltransferase
VRRSRRLPLEELAPYLLHTPQTAELLHWRTVFQNDHPVEIEVGFGKGLFLLSAAQAASCRNFLGIEILRKYQLFTATRMAKRGLRNVRLALGDARVFLRDRVPSTSVEAVHVYFPDPWWKNRHSKRRLFTPDFAVQCERVLSVSGRLHVITDVETYFATITNLVTQHTRLGRQPIADMPEPLHDLDYRTNFERKFRKEGWPIFRALYERR